MMFAKERKVTQMILEIDVEKLHKGDIIGFTVKSSADGHALNSRATVGCITTVTPQGMMVYDLVDKVMRNISPAELVGNDIIILNTVEELVGEYKELAGIQFFGM